MLAIREITNRKIIISQSNQKIFPNSSFSPSLLAENETPKPLSLSFDSRHSLTLSLALSLSLTSPTSTLARRRRRRPGRRARPATGRRGPRERAAALGSARRRWAARGRRREGGCSRRAGEEEKKEFRGGFRKIRGLDSGLFKQELRETESNLR